MVGGIIEGYTYVRDDVIALVPDDAASILDIGCSDGATGRALKARKPAVRLVGLDVSEVGVAKTRTDYDAAYVVDLNAPDGLAPIEGQTFDAILAPDVLEHLVDPTQVLKRLMRHLSSTGVIVVSLPNIQHWAGIFTIARGRFPRDPAGLFDHTHLRWFTRHEAEQMFSECGLQITERKNNLKLSLSRRAKILWPILQIAPDYFSMQMLFKLRPT
jgi:2-polyprenyl-3-methyl-5-hydroxy-6-metoxy-1,4-benzoquinol methylase